MVQHVAPAPQMIITSCLTIGHYMGTADIFVVLCRLRLTDTQVLLSANVPHMSVIEQKAFRVMVHVHVPRYFL